MPIKFTDAVRLSCAMACPLGQVERAFDADGALDTRPLVQARDVLGEPGPTLEVERRRDRPGQDRDQVRVRRAARLELPRYFT